jgi:hypothetical protein
MNKKSIISTILALAMLLIGYSGTAVAAEQRDALTDTYEHIGETITAIESQLSSIGSSVEIELNSIISDYQIKLENANDIETANKLQDLIDAAGDLLVSFIEYKEYDQFVSSSNQSFSTQSLPGVTTTLYDAPIAAIVTWFSTQGYYLSYELLLHAKANTTVGSTYSPVNKNIIVASSVTQGIMQKIITTSQQNGSGEYSSGDLYYAIHLFSWHRGPGNNVLIITDVYDFAPGDYSGLAGTAVNIMYYAQNAGVIVPFNLEVYIS